MLEHLEVVTVFLSEENNVSISGVLPILHGLITKLEANDDDSSCIKEFKAKRFLLPYEEDGGLTI